MKRLSKTVPNLGSDLANIVNSLVEELETSQAATAKAKKEDERQKGLVLEAEKTKKNVLNIVASKRELVAVASTHEA